MRKLLIAIILWSAVSSASSVYADWQYTKWGMTPEQFAFASGGKASVVPLGQADARNGSPCLVRGTYQSGSQVFNLEGCFSGQSLNRVVLKVQGSASRSDAQELLANLAARYGRPTVMQPNYKWADIKGGNAIEVLEMDQLGMFEIHYTPLRAGGGL